MPRQQQESHAFLLVCQKCGFFVLFLVLVVSSCEASSSHRVVAFATLPNNEASLWLVRAASASLTYVGLVVALDRPRGTVYVSNNLRVAPSQVPSAGLGLYCTKDMRKDTILGTYPGVVLPLQQNLSKLKQYPACEAFIWRFSDNQMVIDPTNAKGQMMESMTMTRGGNPSTFGSTFLLEKTILGTLFQVPTTLCRINEPPPGSSVNVVTDENLEKRQVTLTVSRDVYDGEELFMDYGVTYDRSGYGPSPPPPTTL